MSRGKAKPQAMPLPVRRPDPFIELYRDEIKRRRPAGLRSEVEVAAAIEAARAILHGPGEQPGGNAIRRDGTLRCSGSPLYEAWANRVGLRGRSGGNEAVFRLSASRPNLGIPLAMRPPGRDAAGVVATERVMIGPLPTPGTLAARDMGCSCDVSKPGPVIGEATCPLHGRRVTDNGECDRARYVWPPKPGTASFGATTWAVVDLRPKGVPAYEGGECQPARLGGSAI